MTRASPPPVEIDPDVLRDAESVLDEGESLSSFVTECVRRGAAWRRTQDEFLARSRGAIERGGRERSGIASQELLRRMDDRINALVDKTKP